MDQIRAMLDRIVLNEGEADVVQVSGGEPTIHPDFIALLDRVPERNIPRIVVNTNGALITKRLQSEAWKTWLADTDVIVVSLDALDLDTLRGLWVTKRPEDVLRNIMLLAELARPMRFKLMVNCVIRPGHIGDARGQHVSLPTPRFVQSVDRLKGFLSCELSPSVQVKLLAQNGSDRK